MDISIASCDVAGRGVWTVGGEGGEKVGPSLISEDGDDPSVVAAFPCGSDEPSVVAPFSSRSDDPSDVAAFSCGSDDPLVVAEFS